MNSRKHRAARRGGLVVALASLALCAGPPGALASHAFSDVPNAAPFHDEIGIFKGTNITSGCTATTFCPQNAVLRQAMAAYVVRALGLVIRPGESTFKAVPGSLASKLDDDQSLVGTDGNVLRVQGPNDNIVAGFSANSVTSGVIGATIAGGGESAVANTVTDDYGTVGGGSRNRAGDAAGTTSNAKAATIAGGTGNTASAIASTVAGGASNTSSGTASAVIGGSLNTADGGYATVAGGYQNSATGSFSFAGGWGANAVHNGSFVWTDAQGGNFNSTAPNEFSVRAGGGVRLLGNVGVGMAPIPYWGNSLVTSGPIRAGVGNQTNCDLYLGDDICLYDEQAGVLSVLSFDTTAYAPVKASAFNVSSTARLKRDLVPLRVRDERALLRTLQRLPLYSFRYANEPSSGSPHTGVIAERSPGTILAPDRKSVNLYDYIGLNVGATKALSAKVGRLERRNALLAARVAGEARALRRANARLAALERAVTALKRKVR